MEKSERTIGKTLKKIFLSNWVIKLVSLAFALLLWGFVLTNLNPERTKTISGVQASFDGEADLIARRLVVRGDYEEIMSNVTVRVNTELTSYADLSSEDITCTISLRNVNVEGEYDLRLEAVSSSGSVLSVSPATLHVEVDSLSSRRIPVEIESTGSVPEGYYMGEPVLSRSEIEIEGPYTDIVAVSKAIATIDYEGRTESISQSVSLTLVDSDGNEVDSSLMYGEVPSVTINVEILAQKNVGFDIEGALIGLEYLPEDQELLSAYALPGTITILGEKEVLDSITALEIDTIDITGITDRTVVLEDREFYLPSGVRTLSEITAVDVYVTIREKYIDREYSSLVIHVEDVESGLSYTISPENVTLVLNGRISVINSIERSDIQLYVSVSDLGAGTYSLPIELRLLVDTDSYVTWTVYLAGNAITAAAVALE